MDDQEVCLTKASEESEGGRRAHTKIAVSNMGIISGSCIINGSNEREGTSRSCWSLV